MNLPYELKKAIEELLEAPDEDRSLVMFFVEKLREVYEGETKEANQKSKQQTKSY